jgi:hypothetical protein
MFVAINYNLFQLVITHIFFIILFALIYLYLFSNIDKHYIFNNNILRKDYIENKIINALYLSMNLETTTGFDNINLKSTEAKLIGIIQMFISLIVTVGYIKLALNK